MGLVMSSKIENGKIIPDADLQGRISIEKIEWNNGFSVGVDFIDRQHQRLFDMLNEMIEERENTQVDSELVSETLSRMVAYAREHFKDEEQYMKSIDYPEYNLHFQQHSDFRKKSVEFCMNAWRHKKSIPTDIMLYLKEWLLHHILISDLKYSYFARDNGLQ